MNGFDLISRLRSSPFVSGVKGVKLEVGVAGEVTIEIPQSFYCEFMQRCREDFLFPNPRIVFFCFGPNNALVIRIDESYSGVGVTVVVVVSDGLALPSIADVWPAVRWHEREAFASIRSKQSPKGTSSMMVVGAVSEVAP